LANIDTDDTIGLYLKEVIRVPLLTAEEEVDLAQRMNAGVSQEKSWRSATPSVRKAAGMRSLIEDGWAAREHLITANSRLRYQCWQKSIGTGRPISRPDSGRQHRINSGDQKI
jgi:RNA polymerase primary sigma factor